MAEKHYPFKKYKINTTPTQKRAIQRDLLAEIFKLDLTLEHPCFHARNYFVISYLLNGMNFYDVALITKDNIVNGRVQYQRNKTSKPFDVKITPALQELLNYNVLSNRQYIFDIVKRQTPDLIDKDIKWARKRYNKKLIVVADLCGIDTNLTSYVSRHSFATEARRQNVPIDAIKTMLGHSSVKTTEIYLAGLPSDLLDEFNARIAL